MSKVLPLLAILLLALLTAPSLFEEGGATMKKLIAVLVLVVGGAGRAEEMDILERLKEDGVAVRAYLGADGSEAVMVTFTLRSADAGLAELCELRRLRTLVLERRPVTDAQMRDIGGLRGLQFLVLSGPSVTDANLRHLNRLRNLKVLMLTGAKVTDTGLEELAALPDLDTLFVDDTPITDAGLRRVERLRKLKSLVLVGCHGITDEGVARLKKALPDCTIHR
jgi:hypothetical protein